MPDVAIRVDPDDKSQQLDPMSRINFGGIFTIQHNIKVKPLGLVNSRSIDALLAHFQNVFVKQLHVAVPIKSVPRTITSVANGDDGDGDDENDEDREDEEEDDDDDDDEDEDDDDDDGDDDGDDNENK